MVHLFINRVHLFNIDPQYEDWAEDMFYELIGEKETQEFVEAFNRAAENRATYCIGEAIDLEN